MYLRYIGLFLLTGLGGIVSGLLWLVPNGLMAGALGMSLSAGTLWLGLKQAREGVAPSEPVRLGHRGGSGSVGRCFAWRSSPSSVRASSAMNLGRRSCRFGRRWLWACYMESCCFGVTTGGWLPGAPCGARWAKPVASVFCSKPWPYSFMKA